MSLHNAEPAERENRRNWAEFLAFSLLQQFLLKRKPEDSRPIDRETAEYGRRRRLSADCRLLESRGADHLEQEVFRSLADMIDDRRAQHAAPWLLKSAECAIRENGSLALPDEILAQLDLTICNVQSHFDLAQRQQTERLVRAMDHPAFNILAEPGADANSGHQRYAVDLERVMRAASEQNCVLEIDTHPLHPELPDIHWRMAREAVAKIALGRGAHRGKDLENLRFSLLQARHGWLEQRDVINTCTLDELRTVLQRN